MRAARLGARDARAVEAESRTSATRCGAAQPFAASGGAARLRALRRRRHVSAEGPRQDAAVVRAVAGAHRFCARARNAESDADWDDSRIPNLIIRGAARLRAEGREERRAGRSHPGAESLMRALFIVCRHRHSRLRHPHSARAVHGGPVRRLAGAHHADSRRVLAVPARRRAVLGAAERSLRPPADSDVEPRGRVRVVRDSRASRTNLWWLLLSRVLAGFMAGNISAAFAYASDISAPENRAKALGTVGAAIGVGLHARARRSAACSRGNDEHTANFTLPAAVSAALSLVAISLVYFMLPESHAAEHRTQQHEPRRRIRCSCCASGRRCGSSSPARSWSPARRPSSNRSSPSGR